MKTVKISIFKRLTLVRWLFAIAVTICLAILALGIANEVGVIIGFGAILLAVTLLALILAANYGMRISEEKITLISQDMFKTFRRDDISYVAVIFTKYSIYGEIKTNSQEYYPFSFSDIELSYLPGLSKIMKARLKLSEGFVLECIESLEGLDKFEVFDKFREQ